MIKTILTLLVFSLPAWSQLAFDTATSNSGSATTSITLTNNNQVQQGYYICGVAAGRAPSNPVDVTDVSGGGLNWTEKIEQAGTEGTHIRLEVWEAHGTPTSDNFTITVQTDASGQIAAACLVYSGFKGQTSKEDSNSETDTGADITLSASSAPEIAYIVFVNTRNSTITANDANYTGRANDITQSATRIYGSDSSTDNIYAATVGASVGHTEAGLILRRRRIK